MDEFAQVIDAIDRVGVSLAIVIVLLIALWRIAPSIKRYIEVVISQKEERAKHDGEINELVRLSNLVIENNTETLKIVNQYSKQAEDLIRRHDVDSAERQQRIEAQVGQALGGIGDIMIGVEVIKAKGN